MNRQLVAVIISLLASADALSAQPLIGDRVPPLGDQLTWLQGDSAPEFETGKVYLLDFWATWCPPCYPMIDHLSELQNRYGASGLVVIGIAVGTDVGTPLPRFLEKEGPRFSYAVAEPVLEQELKSRLVHPSIMDPDDFSLPFVMLVDRQGRLAWTSDPRGTDDELDEALAAVMNGTFDLQAQADSSRFEGAVMEEMSAELERVGRLRDEGRLAEATRALLPIAERLPRQYAAEAVALFQQILCAGQNDLAATYGRELLNGVLQDRVSELVQAERSILALQGDDRRDLALAELMTRRALELKGGNHPDFLFELAKVLAAQGRLQEAESARRRASRAAEEQRWQDNYVHYISTVDLNRALEQQASGLHGACEETRTHGEL